MTLTVYFPIINNSHPKFHIDTTHLEQGKTLYIDFTAHFGHVTCIHCEVVNLPNPKEEQGIPEPYSLFDKPYKVQLLVCFQERDIVLQIIYFDISEGSDSTLFALNNLTLCSYVL